MHVRKKREKGTDMAKGMSKETAKAIKVFVDTKGMPKTINEFTWNAVMYKNHMNTTLRTAAKYMGYVVKYEWVGWHQEAYAVKNR